MKLSTLLAVHWLTSPPSQAWAIQTTEQRASCDGDFNDGVYFGADTAESIWDDNGSSCSNIWYFENDVYDYLDEYYPTDTSDWRKNSCHKGMYAGADQVVDKYEKRCLEDSPDECYDLGQAAAQQIAFDYCPFSAAGSYSHGEPDYKKSCRQVAYGVCEGAIYGYVKDNGCDDISTSKLKSLQEECKGQVDSMTGGGEQTVIVPECKNNGKNYKRCAKPVASKDKEPCGDIKYYVCGDDMKPEDKSYCKCIGLYDSKGFFRSQ